MMNIKVGNYHVKARIGVKKQQQRKVLSLYLSLFCKGMHQEDSVISLGKDIDIEWVGRGKYGQPKGTGTHAEEIRNISFRTLTTLETALNELASDSKELDRKKILGVIHESIKGIICGKSVHGLRKEHMELVKKRTLRNICDDYLKNRQIQKKNFNDAVKFYENFSGANPLVHEVTHEQLEKFKAYLYDRCLHNSVVTYLRKLNTILIYATKKGIIPQNPMPPRFIGRCKPGGVQALTIAEIEKIKSIDDSQLKEFEQRVKYILLLQLSTGLGYSELKSLKKTDVVESETGVSFDSDRQKSGKPYFVPLSPLALNMYKRIASEDGSPFDHLFSSEFFIRCAKQLASKAGIKKNITSTTGRKTFATHWVLAGNSIYDLSKILGHTDVKQTMEYVRYDNIMAEVNAQAAYERMPFIIS